MFKSQLKPRSFCLSLFLVAVRLSYLRIIVLGCCFILCDPQTELKASCIVEGCHGHASVDELRETVRDLGYHGDVVNLIIVSNSVIMVNCDMQRTSVRILFLQLTCPEIVLVPQVISPFLLA